MTDLERAMLEGSHAELLDALNAHLKEDAEREAFYEEAERDRLTIAHRCQRAEAELTELREAVRRHCGTDNVGHYALRQLIEEKP